MLRQKAYLSNDDLSLSCKALKIIVNLHSTLPKKNADKWLNIDEMCKRLIHCGVVDSLLPEHVLKALKDSNRSGVLSCRMHHRIKYYRPSLFTGGAPQDLSSINYCSSCPSKDFFLSAERNEDNGIERLNSELRNISKLQESIDGTSICLLMDVGTQTSSANIEPGDTSLNVNLKGPWKNAWTWSITEDMQREANERMTPENELKMEMISNEEDYSDGYGFFSIQKLLDFIHETTEHAACCGVSFHLERMNFNHGAAIIADFRCSRCSQLTSFNNCEWIKTGVVEEGRSYSRLQPEINIRIPKAAREVGVNLEKVIQFVTFLGVKMCTYRNLLHSEKKIRAAITDLSHDRLDSNLREHVAATRNQIGYLGDILWTDSTGTPHSTCRGPGSFDGAGLTRAYNHRIKGSQTVLVVFSMLTKKPISAVHMQTKCLLCTRAYNKANENREQIRYLDSHCAMEHEGRCHRNTVIGAGSHEEYAATEAARSMLLDHNGLYRGDDSASFLDEITTDNDTRGPSKFIMEQNKIIGETSDSLAEQLPDGGHVMKNCSNAFYKIRKNDPSFNGSNLLENTRIKSIVSDIRSALNVYKEKGIGNKEERMKCLNTIYAIVPHHCGDHTSCNYANICKYTEIKANNASWSDFQIQSEYATHAVRFGGRYMDLSESGKQTIQKEITKRFSMKNIDRLARLSCSNSCEAYFGVLTKYSEGKRLCLEHGDLWKSMILFVFCRTGNIEQTHLEISSILDCRVTTAEMHNLDWFQKKREMNKIMATSKKGKQKRHVAKITQVMRTGKNDNKTCHKSDKVDVTKSHKVRIKRCIKCKSDGHTATCCPTVKNKRNPAKKFTRWKHIHDAPTENKKKSQTAKVQWNNFV